MLNFLSNIFCQLNIFSIFGHHKLESGSGVRFRWKSLDPDLNPDPKHYHFSYMGWRGSSSKKEVIILDLPAVYRGAITIIKGNESNPPVCKGPTQQECLLENRTVLINVFLLYLSEVQVPESCMVKKNIGTKSFMIFPFSMNVSRHRKDLSTLVI